MEQSVILKETPNIRSITAYCVQKAQPIVIQLYNESLQRFRLAADGHGYYLPPEQHRERIRTWFDPLPTWYEPFEHNQLNTDDYPLHALTQRPMHMYHSWGSQNAWLRQITTFKPAVPALPYGGKTGCNRRRLGLGGKPARQSKGTGKVHDRSQSGYRLDLECHWQT